MLAHSQGAIVPPDIEAINAAIISKQGARKQNLLPLPDSWDSRETTQVPVLAQGGCGSCWAFASATAASYSATRELGQSIVISPQWIMDKSLAGNGCVGGWIDFVPMLVNGTDRCGVHGAILNRDWPYLARFSGAACDALPARYVTFNEHRLYGWRGANVAPDIEDVKRGIMECGAVAAGIRIGGDLQFSRSWQIIRGAPGAADHVVTLVGWGIEDGEQYFIVHNSWGTVWGVNGFGRVAVDSLNVGYGAMGVTGARLIQPIPELTPQPVGMPQPTSETAYTPDAPAPVKVLPIVPRETKIERVIRFDWPQLAAFCAVILFGVVLNRWLKEVAR